MFKGRLVSLKSVIVQIEAGPAQIPPRMHETARACVNGYFGPQGSKQGRVHINLEPPGVV